MTKEHIQLLIGRVAESGSRLANPLLGRGLVGEVHHWRIFCIAHRLEIGFRRVFPAILELLGHATATLGEARITDIAVGREYLPPGGLHRLAHMPACLLGNALVALAVVIGTHIEDGMVLTIVPPDKRIVFLDKREETPRAFGSLLATAHLCQ